MCNLYNITTTQQAMRNLFRSVRDSYGNLPESLNVYPNGPAPVIRRGEDGAREIVRLSWGMPTPPKFVKGAVDRGVTNIRNVKSPHWRRWLAPESRCIVPATRFAEPAPKRDPETGRIPNVWFAIDETEPIFVFAGIWTPWHGVRKKADGPLDHTLFGFLTCEPNAVVAPIHPKAMPVILTTEDEIETWLTAPAEEALALQRPLPNDGLRIVERDAE